MLNQNSMGPVEPSDSLSTPITAPPRTSRVGQAAAAIWHELSPAGQRFVALLADYERALPPAEFASFAQRVEAFATLDT